MVKSIKLLIISGLVKFFKAYFIENQTFMSKFNVPLS